MEYEVKKAEFIKSFHGFKDYEDLGLPEIAFLGRSNVGKSSLINSLVRRKSLAKTSRTPGRTQSINLFKVNDLYTFVDLPGFGYAKASKSLQQNWQIFIADYLKKSQQIALFCYLFDVRRSPNQEDLRIFEWVLSFDRPVMLIGTKADKLSKNQSKNQLKKIVQSFQLEMDNCLLYSVPKRKGREDLWHVIESVV